MNKSYAKKSKERMPQTSLQIYKKKLIRKRCILNVAKFMTISNYYSE